MLKPGPQGPQPSQGLAWGDLVFPAWEDRKRWLDYGSRRPGYCSYVADSSKRLILLGGGLS